MTEVWFYHLERSPLDRVLPGLLEKTLDREWRANIRAGSQERAEALDTHLWTYRDDSFLPHGMAGGDWESEHPIYLTTKSENPNGASILFLVDGAQLEKGWDTDEVAQYHRCVTMFDGHDAAAVERARSDWRAATEAGHEVTYWQQNAEGRWEKKA